MSEHAQPEKNGRDVCYFCERGEGVLESHHIVPQRHGGSDADENLVDLCPTCHERLERLYDKRFYDKLGVGNVDKIVDEVIQIVQETEISRNRLPNTAPIVNKILNRYNREKRQCIGCERFGAMEQTEDGIVCQRCGTVNDE